MSLFKVFIYTYTCMHKLRMHAHCAELHVHAPTCMDLCMSMFLCSRPSMHYYVRTAQHAVLVLHALCINLLQYPVPAALV